MMPSSSRARPQAGLSWIHDGAGRDSPGGAPVGHDDAGIARPLRAELGESRVRLAMIGPGGEKLVRFACVINDPAHAAGPHGLGAVMGSKNLKAVAARGKASTSRRPIPRTGSRNCASGCATTGRNKSRAARHGHRRRPART